MIAAKSNRSYGMVGENMGMQEVGTRNSRCCRMTIRAMHNEQFGQDGQQFTRSRQLHGPTELGSHLCMANCLLWVGRSAYRIVCWRIVFCIAGA